MDALTIFRSRADAHSNLAANWSTPDACIGHWRIVECSGRRVTSLVIPFLDLRGPCSLTWTSSAASTSTAIASTAPSSPSSLPSPTSSSYTSPRTTSPARSRQLSATSCSSSASTSPATTSAGLSLAMPSPTSPASSPFASRTTSSQANSWIYPPFSPTSWSSMPPTTSSTAGSSMTCTPALAWHPLLATQASAGLLLCLPPCSHSCARLSSLLSLLSVGGALQPQLQTERLFKCRRRCGGRQREAQQRGAKQGCHRQHFHQECHVPAGGPSSSKSLSSSTLILDKRPEVKTSDKPISEKNAAFLFPVASPSSISS